MSEADLEAVARIWNPVIRDTAVTFATQEKTAAELRAWLASGGPRLTAERDGRVVGFASAAQFRAGAGYAACLEHSVFVARSERGGGVGRALMAALEAAARADGAHSLVAGVSGENGAAVAFHRRLGFVEVGRVIEAGRKFGRWLDLVLMQKML